jgi:hypothetical protein
VPCPKPGIPDILSETKVSNTSVEEVLETHRAFLFRLKTVQWKPEKCPPPILLFPRNHESHHNIENVGSKGELWRGKLHAG